MSDAVPRLADGFDATASPFALASNIRARTTGPSNVPSSSEGNAPSKHRREGSAAQDPGRCCKKTPPGHRKAKYPIAFIASTWGFLTNIERAIILPTMWLFFKNYWGEATAASFYPSTLGVFSLSILIATPLFGCAGHAKVNVKYLLLLANLLEVVGNLAYLCASSPWLVFIGRMIAGVGASCEPPMYADLTRATEFHERTPFIIVLLLSRQVGLIFGPAFTLILDRLDVQVFDMKVNVYNGPGLVMACLWVLHSILILIFYPNLDKSGVYSDDVQKSASGTIIPTSDEGAPNTRVEVRFTGFWQYRFLTLYATTFASYYSVMALESVLSPLANRAFNWGAVEVSYIYIAASILVIVVSGIMHFMSKCIEDRKLIVVGLVFLIVSYTYLTVVIDSLGPLGEWGKALVVVGVGIHVIGMPFPLAISESLYTKFVPAPRLDHAQTILRTVINVAFLVGPYVGGSFQAQPTSVFMSMVLINFISLAMFLCKFGDFQITPEMQVDNAPASVRPDKSHLSV
ncbi:unnamed protein product [Mesocestoides corti]|uniref:MFS domain-containing protein n=1 Tax=Mesocestoides corti TaxID=53468 RepID=A0A0R3UJ41_MESCO|nr:unnamed protein product [Mesocestoides corti]